MKFVRFVRKGSSAAVGVLHNDQVFELAGFGESMEDLIAKGDEGLRQAREAVSQGSGIPLQEVKLLAPMQRPPRIFGIGQNYKSHAEEVQIQTTPVPTVFFKLPSSLTGPDSDIILPKNSTEPDFEVELAVVIGKPGFRVGAEDWQEYVWGYTIVNDVSARDVQFATTQWSLGKSFPTFTPLGPALVTADAIADPHNLAISLTIDGEMMQNSNTRLLIFKIPQLIEYLSSITPLEVGDIICTGTPEGVGYGRMPRRWLKPDEKLVLSIEHIGELRNTTRAEQ